MHSIQNVRYFCLRIFLQFYFFSNSYKKKNFRPCIMHHCKHGDFYVCHSAQEKVQCLTRVQRMLIVTRPTIFNTHIILLCFFILFFGCISLSHFLSFGHIFNGLSRLYMEKNVPTNLQTLKHSWKSRKNCFFSTKRTIITLKRLHAQKWDFEKERKSGKKKKNEKRNKI